nr:hypothetical protein [Tanacetum cinerariifolium]
MTSLADKAILSGADNLEENRVTRPKKYSKLSATEAIQADCDVKETNIILQGLPPEVYALYASQAQSSTPLSIIYPSNDFQSTVHHNVYNPSSSIPQVEYAPSVHQQFDFSQPDTGLVILVFQKVEENRVTRPKKYSKLSATEAIQADCDVKETNIILQGLPPEVYAL